MIQLKCMSFSIGIIGLPNVGKSTLFKALTQQEVDISNYPFCTIDPNVGIVKIPDKRLKQLEELLKPEETIPTVIEFVDIAGLVKGAHKGEGLGNQFLARIREVNAIIHVVCSFTDKDIKHVEDSLDINRDIEIVNTELIMKDLETIEKHDVSKEIKDTLDQGKLLSELKNLESVKELNLLTVKPVIYLINSKGTDDELQAIKSLPDNTIGLDLKLELEYSDLNEQELEELKIKTRLDVLIKTSYKLLDLITFYTIKGGKETRAWTLKQGKLAPKAGGIVHNDFEEKFIRAEAINYKDLIESESWNKARQKGLIRTEGKNYIVQDGDVIEFKI